MSFQVFWESGFDLFFSLICQIINYFYRNRKNILENTSPNSPE